MDQNRLGKPTTSTRDTAGLDPSSETTASCSTNTSEGAGVDELQRSIIYNDYGRTDTFNWDLEAGDYTVSVSIGWDGKTYSKQRVVVEGQVLFDDFETTPGNPYEVRSVDVTISDGNLTLEIGQQGEYTMVNWLSIVPKE